MVLKNFYFKYIVYLKGWGIYGICYINYIYFIQKNIFFKNIFRFEFYFNSLYIKFIIYNNQSKSEINVQKCKVVMKIMIYKVS